MAIASKTVASPDVRIDLSGLNSRLDGAIPGEIVKWAAAEFGAGLVMTSSFGAESAALLHMASREMPGIRVIMIDTGYLFPETYQFMERLRSEMGLNVWPFRTRNDPFVYLRESGESDPEWRQDVQRCCAANKNEPMERAMRQLQPKAWLRGIRRSQAPTRERTEVVEWSRRYNCYAISPLLAWFSRDVHLYLKEHGLPYHPLWEQGYTSIGCNPRSCTRAVANGEDARAGRWAGLEKTECGINHDDSLDSATL